MVVNLYFLFYIDRKTKILKVHKRKDTTEETEISEEDAGNYFNYYYFCKIGFKNPQNFPIWLETHP